MQAATSTAATITPTSAAVNPSYLTPTRSGHVTATSAAVNRSTLTPTRSGQVTATSTPSSSAATATSSGHGPSTPTSSAVYRSKLTPTRSGRVTATSTPSSSASIPTATISSFSAFVSLPLQERIRLLSEKLASVSALPVRNPKEAEALRYLKNNHQWRGVAILTFQCFDALTVRRILSTARIAIYAIVLEYDGSEQLPRSFMDSTAPTTTPNPNPNPNLPRTTRLFGVDIDINTQGGDLNTQGGSIYAGLDDVLTPPGGGSWREDRITGG